MEPKKMLFLRDIVQEIPKVECEENEINDKLETVLKNIALVPNPGKDVIIAKQKSRFC